MKADALAKLLLQTPYAEVLVFDADANDWMPVSGLVTALATNDVPNPHDLATIKLYSDEL